MWVKYPPQPPQPLQLAAPSSRGRSMDELSSVPAPVSPRARDAACMSRPVMVMLFGAVQD